MPAFSVNRAIHAHPLTDRHALAIEAELKARVEDPDRVRRCLRQRASEEIATYENTYYDWPDQNLYRTGRELRLRTIRTSEGARYLLTFKAAPVDAASQSKPEHETEVGEREPVEAALIGLGLEVWVRLTKNVLNYRLSVDGREILASLVTVPELDGTFIEIETLAEPEEVGTALAVLRKTLVEIGISDHALTTERYDDAVRKQRAGRPGHPA